jgi:hypothetical protein
MATTVYTADDCAVSVRRDSDDAWTIELDGDDELRLGTQQMRMIVDGFLSITTGLEDADANRPITEEDAAHARWLLNLPEDEQRRLMDLADARERGAFEEPDADDA